MNLRNEILKEHSKRMTTKIVNYVGSNQSRFDELIELFLSKEDVISQRAAWAVSYCAIEHPNLVKKHLKRILLNLEKPVHVAVRRNTIRLLKEIEIPPSLQGIAADICFRLLHSKEEAIAVRAFAMVVLGNICKTHPEMKHELKLSIEEVLPYASAGMLSCARKVLKSIS